MGRGSGKRQLSTVFKLNLDNLSLDSVDKFLADNLLEDQNISTWKRNYALERIVRLNKADNDKAFKDYFKREWKNIYSPTKFSANILKDLLLLEYGKLPRQYREIKPEIKTLAVKNIIAANQKHYDNLPSDRVSIYSKIALNTPIGVVRRINRSEYRIVDGHHRLKGAKTAEKSEILVWVV